MANSQILSTCKFFPAGATESKAVGFEQWGKAYGFGLHSPQLFTGEILSLALDYRLIKQFEI